MPLAAVSSLQSPLIAASPFSGSGKTTWVGAVRTRIHALIESIGCSGPERLRYQSPSTAWPADAARPDGMLSSHTGPCAGVETAVSREVASLGPSSGSLPGEGDDSGRYRTELVVSADGSGDVPEDVSAEVRAVLGLPIELELTGSSRFVVRSVWESATPPDPVFADLAMRSVLSGVMCNVTGDASAEVRVVSYDRHAIGVSWSLGEGTPRPVFEQKVGAASKRSSGRAFAG